MADSPAHRILFVEDHLDTSQVMKLLLERRGFEVHIASDMQSAIRLWNDSTSNDNYLPFDLLISDIGLPDGSGLELVRHIRSSLGANNGAKHFKAIALSGFGTEDDLARSKEAGFDEHLIKPYSFQKLMDAIEHLSPKA